MFNSNSPRVLVAAPFSDQKDYCIDAWIESVKALSYPNYDILLVDNSHNEEYYQEIGRRHVVQVQHLDPGKDTAPVFISKSQNVLRNKVIAEQYDYLMMVEVDVTVPPNIIEYLLSWGANVVSACYMIMHEEETTLCVLDCEVEYRSKRTRKLTGVEGYMMFDGDLKTIFSGGIGCTLIHHDICKRFPFRVDALKEKGAFSDSFFGWDLKLAGIDQYIDTSILLDHDRRSWSSNYDYSKK